MPGIGTGLGIGYPLVGSKPAVTFPPFVKTRLDAYADLLTGAGGSNIRVNGQYNNIGSFASALYTLFGDIPDFFAVRSTQNMGTGITAYSFLGNAGVLVNGPTWGVDGINWITSSKMTATLPAGALFAIYSCLKPSALGLQLQSYLGAGEGAFWTTYSDDNFYNQIGTSFAIGSGISAGIWYTFCGLTNARIRNLCKNGAVLATQSGAAAGVVLGSKDLFNAATGPVMGSFIMPVNMDFSDAQILSIHNAYKTTIGLGLGLP